MIRTRHPSSIATLLALAAVAAACSAVRAGEAVAEQPIGDAREAFSDGSFPWYDSQTDSLQPLRFRDRPEWKPWDLGPVLQVVVWTLLAVLLAVIVILLIYFFRHQAARATAALQETAGGMLAADQVEALPFLAERRRDDLLGQARYHYQQGNYSEAIIYLFSYELVQLDKFSVIRLSKGKTNRQYLRETARVAALRPPLEQTLVAFEGVFFGRRSLDRAGFELCWNALPQFEQHLRAAP